ncbi:hypothetical protein OH807_22415 [Kitasatospora sp. NBC_01560]|uniref:hypothetical protein n=1 Tax=Kitasatospora sp. NBC_01560 TaxID=2975965 RepID=UPI00386FFC46
MSTALSATSPAATSSSATALPTRLLLGLYPATYRASHGAEIAAVFAESVEGADRRTVRREWAALAAHALRLRTGLSSRDRAGRIAAGAAPYLLAGGAALSAVHLLLGLVLGQPFGAEAHHPAVTAVVGAAQTLPWVLALVFAVLGRWRQARLLVLLGMVLRTAAAAAVFVLPYATFYQYYFLYPLWLLLGAVLLAAPPDAVDLSPRARTGTAAAALAVAVPMTAVVALWPWREAGDYSEPVFSAQTQNVLDALTAWPAVVMSLAFLVHFGARRPDRLRAAGAALATLPWMVMLPAPLYLRPPLGVDAVRNLAVVGALLALCTVVAVLRRAFVRAVPIPVADEAEPV